MGRLRSQRATARSKPEAGLGAEERQAFALAAVQQDATHLGLRVPEGTFIVAATDEHVGRGLWIKRARPEFRVLSRAVALIESLCGAETIRGRTFVDVGANIGTSTIAALNVHGFGRAIACEPHEANHRLLCANLFLNGLESRARPINVGVSSAPGRAQLVTSEQRPGESFVARDPAAYEAEKARLARLAVEAPQVAERELTVVDVPLTSLDVLVADGVIDPDAVGLLWVDAEGHESEILEGATTLCGRGTPIAMELYPAGLSARADLDPLYGIVERHYTHFVDLRRPEREADQRRGRLRSVGELRELSARFLDPDQRGRFTDVLLLRLDGSLSSGPVP